MNKKILKLEIIGFVITSIIGTVMHFMYDWFGIKLLGLVCPVNESAFEHLKLLFFPYIIYGVVESVKLTGDKCNVYFAKLVGILCGIFTTLGIYYIVLGGFERQIDAINILSYFIGMAVAYLVSYVIISHNFGGKVLNAISIIIIIAMCIAFMYLTFYPVQIPLFLDPQTGTYSFN